jgi:hypothetical protein
MAQPARRAVSKAHDFTAQGFGSVQINCKGLFSAYLLFLPIADYRAIVLPTSTGSNRAKPVRP